MTEALMDQYSFLIDLYQVNQCSYYTEGVVSLTLIK